MYGICEFFVALMLLGGARTRPNTICLDSIKMQIFDIKSMVTIVFVCL